MTLLQAPRSSVRLTEALGSTTARVVLAGTAAAWVALVLPWPVGAHGHGETESAAAHHPLSVTLPDAGPVDPWSPTWVATWLLMVVAMMWPLAVPTVGAIGRSSFRGWRTRLGGVCLATVTVLWLAFGLAGAMLARTLSFPPGSVWWQLSCVCLALVALRSARRSRLLEKCQRLPALAPGGRRGVVTATMAGVLTWRRCALLCGPMMMAMTVGHSPVLMVCASLAAWWEAWHPRAWRDPVPVILVGAAGAWLATDALLGALLRGGGRLG